MGQKQQEGTVDAKSSLKLIFHYKFVFIIFLEIMLDKLDILKLLLRLQKISGIREQTRLDNNP